MSTSRTYHICIYSCMIMIDVFSFVILLSLTHRGAAFWKVWLVKFIHIVTIGVALYLADVYQVIHEHCTLDSKLSWKWILDCTGRFYEDLDPEGDRFRRSKPHRVAVAKTPTASNFQAKSPDWPILLLQAK